MSTIAASCVSSTGALRLEQVHNGEDLSPYQQQELRELENQFGDVFYVEPRQTCNTTSKNIWD